MFCQCMTRCYAHEQDPGMAPRCQSLVTYVHSSSVLLPCPGAIRTGTARIAPSCGLSLQYSSSPSLLVRPIPDADSTTLPLYPVGTGSSAIRPSIAPNRRRFRCPSASSSQ